jgi:hypothetical protein
LGSHPEKRGKHLAIVFLLSYLAIVFQFHLIQRPKLPTADALGYVRLADNLAHRGTLAIDAESRTPTPFFPPLYPLLLSGIAKLDAQFAGSLACIGAKEYSVESTSCPPRYGLALYIQFALGALTLTIIWLAGIVIFDSAMIGMIAAICAWATGRLSFYGGLFLTENLFLPLFVGASLLLVLAVRQDSRFAYAGTGILIALAALTRPSAQYCFFAIAMGLIGFGGFQYWRSRTKRLLGGAFILSCACVATLTPWLWRNHHEFGQPFLTDGYASFILVERTSYNDMTWREFGVSFIYWLPWPGEEIARKIFDESDFRRLSFDAEDSFYILGTGPKKQELGRRFKSEAERMEYLLQYEVLGNLGKHSLVSVALAYRGIWIVKYWTLLAVPVLLYLLYDGLFRGRNPSLVLFSLPALFMLGLHAFVSVNVHRYNLILMPSLALASAWIAHKVWEWLRSKFLQI